MKTLSNLFLLCVCFVFHAHLIFAGGPPSRLFVINSPSIVSAGTDSILTFDSLGNSALFFGANHNLQGLRDIGCSPHGPRHIVVSDNTSVKNISELLEFNASGKILETIPFGTPGADVGLAFDRAGNLYVGESTTIFKNGALFASLPNGRSVGRLAIDSGGNLYATSPFDSELFRSDPLGNVTLFADASKGLNVPFGLAIDSMGNVFVANNPPSAPAFILKFEQSGTTSPFASGISFQPSIRGMTFDRDDNLYAILTVLNEILKFDTAGNSSVFADANKGLNFPAAITVGSCPTEQGAHSP